MGIFYIFFLRLISYLEDSEKILTTLAVFLAMGIHILYLKNWKINLKKKELIPLGILVYFIIHTLLFSTLSIQFFGIITSYYLWYLFVKIKLENYNRYDAIKFIMYALTVYNLVNFIWYELEYSHLKTGINTTLGFFNIVAYRVRFPMEGSLTINSAIVGFTSLITMYLIKNTGRSLKKQFYMLLYAFNIYMLIVLDSRSSLLISLMLGMSMALGLRTVIKLVTKYWVYIALSAIVMVNIFYNTDIFKSIKRPGELEEEFFKRPKIWGIALSHTFGDLRFLFGHGINNFADILKQQVKFLNTTHNIFLQVLFDFGVVGIGVMAYFLQKTMRILLRTKDLNLTLIFVAFFLYGCLESMPSYYTFTPTLIFIPIVTIIYNIKE